MEKLMSKFQKYKNYIRVLLEEEYNFNNADVEDVMQTIELAKIEAITRGADEDTAYSIIRKAVSSRIKKIVKDKKELISVETKQLEFDTVENDNEFNSERLENYPSSDESDNSIEEAKSAILGYFHLLSKEEQGILLGGLLKESLMTTEDVLEYTDVVYTLTEKIAVNDPDMANFIYDKLCHIENPQK